MPKNIGALLPLAAPGKKLEAIIMIFQIERDDFALAAPYQRGKQQRRANADRNSQRQFS